MKYSQTAIFHKALLLFITILFSAQPGRSQEIQEIKITGSYSKAPLLEFFSSLEKNYGIKFFYKEEWIKSTEVTKTFNNVPLVQVMNQIFIGKDLTFKFYQNKSVVIYPIGAANRSESGIDDSKVLIIGDPLNQGRYQRAKLQGRVLEGKTGDPLAGAIVYNMETKIGVATDSKGRYTMEMPTGDMHLRITFLSFQNQIQKIRLIQNGNADFELFEESHNLAEITVIGDENNASKAQMSMIKMSAVTLKELPVLMGEADLIKSMVMMPGVQSVGEMSSGFNVRGGNTDQNLVLLNGAPVFNTTHLFGFFSMINPDGVKDVTLYKGGIPASYGERISSVMDVQLKNGKAENLSIYGGLGIINSRLTIEGPFVKKKKSTFMIGGRSTYSDWLLQQTKNPTFMNSVAHFYDVNGTADFELGPRNHLKLTGYLSSDVFNLNSSSLYKYANSLGSLNWKLNLSKKLISNLSLAYSKYDLNMDEKDPVRPEDDYTLKSSIQYGSLKYALSIYPTVRQRINAGFQAIGYWINPGEVVPLQSVSDVLYKSLRHEQSAELALFTDDDFDLSEKLSFNLGLRYTKFINYGPGVVYNYTPGVPKTQSAITDSTVYKSGDIIKAYQGLEPRFAVKYNLADGGSFRLSFQRIHQFVSQISNTAVISPADYWKSADPYLAPLINDQIALGFFKNPGKGKYETSVEMYYKKLQNLMEYKNGAQLLMNNHIETDLLMATGYSYGIELLAKKNEGRLNGWISYTYSRTFRKADSQFSDEKINGGAFYPSVYDKPHDLSAVMNYKISRRWRFSGNFVFSSGRPITLPEQKYIYGEHQVVVFSDRNKYRMPPYHRMDVSLTLDENLRKKRMWKGSWTFSVYNLYGRKNPYSVFYRKGATSQETGQSRYDVYKLSLIGVPVPSITYNFKF
ncbi:MAG: TonB-dependent receptor [Bacteroidia bacterium]|nr:TonB-dependent receptor [Bacteroidia bacterium]